MTTYLYPQNLKATANLWLWGLRGFCHPVYRNTTVGAGPGAARLFCPGCGYSVLWILKHPDG